VAYFEDQLLLMDTHQIGDDLLDLKISQIEVWHTVRLIQTTMGGLEEVSKPSARRYLREIWVANPWSSWIRNLSAKKRVRLLDLRVAESRRQPVALPSDLPPRGH